MYPPIYAICSASSGVKAELGDPPRIYPGAAKQGEQKPYATEQGVGGSPDNTLSGAPRSDSWDRQIDVYGDTEQSVTDAAEALRDAFEAAGAYITRWGGIGRDPDTNSIHYDFDVSFQTTR